MQPHDVIPLPPVPAGTVAHLTPVQVSRITGLARSTLARWRSEKRGIPYVLVSARAARYPLDGVLAWLAARRVEVRP